MSTQNTDIERHPLIPFLPQHAKVLFLGSFPPPKKRWSMDFYYPNFINDHWRIIGAVFFDDKDHFVDLEHKCFRRDDIMQFLNEKGIAYYDTAESVRRLKENASDQFLEVIEPTDMPALLKRIPECRAVAPTGGKAVQTLCETFGITDVPKIGMSVEIPGHKGLRLYRLPSSSRAYPLAFEKKVGFYRSFFDCVL